MSNPNYKAFFESNATTARSTITKEVAAYLSSATPVSISLIAVTVATEAISLTFAYFKM